MTEQLNQVYAYLLKIEEASRKDVTGIQFAFEAGGYAKAAMAICESALNWPKHSKVEVVPERKTGFDFGATRIPPKYGDEYWITFENGPHKSKWMDSMADRFFIEEGQVFLYQTDCQAYCNYLNSLTNED